MSTAERTAPSSSPSAAHSALVAYLFTVVMAATTLPTPLYAIYAAKLDLSPLVITVVYSFYALGVIGALVMFGRLSDHIGRRAVLVLAVACSAVSAVIFMTTFDLPALLVGRFVCGLSAGLVTGSATAYLAELESARGGSRAAVLATMANMGGLGLGPLLAGVLAEHFAHPTVYPYLLGLLLLAPVALVPVIGLRETVEDRDGWRAGVSVQRFGVPGEIRTAFLSAAIAGVAGFALLGFVTALAGQVLGEGLDDHSHQTAGLVAFSLFAAATVAQVVAGRLPGGRASLIGLGAMPLGVVVIVLAVVVSSLPVLVVGGLISGFGVGLAFRAGLSEVTRIAPDERRGEVISTFFLAAYVGLTVPVLAAGVLVTSTNLTVTTVALAAFVTLLAAAAAAFRVRAEREADTAPAT